MSAESSVKPWFELIMEDQYKAVVHFLEDGFQYAGLGETGTHHAAQLGANAIFSSWLVSFVLIGLALIAKSSLDVALKKEGTKKYLASDKFSVLTVFEVYVTFIRNLSDSLVGRKNTNRYFWLFAGIFIYVLTNNLLGLLPGAVSPSQSMSNNLAIGLVVTVAFTVIGFSQQGFGFVKHMMGPLWYMAPLIFVIEFFSMYVVRPGSLALRLAGNMNGDHTVLGIAYQFAEYVLPTVALGLGTFVSFVQAFVFTLLTIIYVVFSLEHDDHH